MDLSEFTTYDDIRAALGVTEDEIEDATLSLAVYQTSLEAELRDLGPTFISDFKVVYALPTKTDAEQWFVKTTALFATYVVARQLTISLPLFSPKDITDGKASLSRYAGNPYQDTIKEVKAQYAVCRSRVESAYASFKATSTPAGTRRTYFATAPRSVDPITGE